MERPNDGREIRRVPPRSTDYGDCFSEQEIRHSGDYRVSGRTVRPPARRRSTVGKVFRFLLILLLILLLAGVVYLALVVFRIHYDTQQPDHAGIIRQVGELKSDSSVENIMLYGADNHAADEYGRSDSMILLSIDKKTGTIKQTSLLRDLYVEIPGYDDNRLNAAFALGGPKLATETIELNFRIRIDSYLVIDFSGFTSLIDAMGGLTLELTAEEIDYINWQCWRNHQVESRHELVVPEKAFFSNKNGEQVARIKLNGRQALWYARDRDSAGADFDRTARQRIVIDTMISQLKDSNIFTIMAVAYQAAPLLTTNMSQWDVLGKLFSVFGLLKYQKKEYAVPRSDNFSFEWVDGASVIGISDQDYENRKLYEFIYGEDTGS